MSFRGSDYLINAAVAADEDLFVFTITEGGYAKRTAVNDYRIQGRGGLGIKVMKQSDDRGHLAGAMLVHENDEVLVILNSGKVVRSNVSEVPAKGRDTMGVVFARHGAGDHILGMARNTERDLGLDPDAEGEDAEAPADAVVAAEDSDTNAAPESDEQ
jgi:DNA gyrase subunit A